MKNRYKVYVAYTTDPKAKRDLIDYLVYEDETGNRYILGRIDLLTMQGEIHPPTPDTSTIQYVDYKKRIGKYLTGENLLELTAYPYCTYEDYFTVNPGITVEYTCKQD